jgi:hypothetical protein
MPTLETRENEMSRVFRILLPLPLVLALTPLAHAQQQQQNCSFERQAGGGDSAFHSTMTVKAGRSCVYVPRAGGGRSRGATTITGLDVTTKPQHGTLSTNENGGEFRLLYAPNAGYVGADHFEVNFAVPGSPASGKRVIDVNVVP